MAQATADAMRPQGQVEGSSAEDRQGQGDTLSSSTPTMTPLPGRGFYYGRRYQHHAEGCSQQIKQREIDDVTVSNGTGPDRNIRSGYGGLTILHGIRQLLPHTITCIWAIMRARLTFGCSFEVVYQFTRQAVLKLFSMGLPSRDFGL